MKKNKPETARAKLLPKERATIGIPFKFSFFVGIRKLSTLGKPNPLSALLPHTYKSPTPFFYFLLVFNLFIFINYFLFIIFYLLFY